MKIHESAENYLETILVLSRNRAEVRSIDIVNKLKFTKPSVSVAMKNLRSNGFIEVDAGGHITLTATGSRIAESMYERHVMITEWLVSLGVDEHTAADDACRMEHVLSEQSFNAIKKYIYEKNK